MSVCPSVRHWSQTRTRAQSPVTDGISDQHKDRRKHITPRGGNQLSTVLVKVPSNSFLLRMPEMDQEPKAPEVAEENVKPGGLSFEVCDLILLGRKITNA